MAYIENVTDKILIVIKFIKLYIRIFNKSHSISYTCINWYIILLFYLIDLKELSHIIPKSLYIIIIK